MPNEIPHFYSALNKLIIFLLSTHSITAKDVVLQRLVNDQRIILSKLNTDNDFIRVLSRSLWTLMLDPSVSTRHMSMSMFKLVMLRRDEVITPLFQYRPSKNEIIDLKKDGFVLLLQKDFTSFSQWMSSNMAKILTVFEETMMKPLKDPSVSMRNCKRPFLTFSGYNRKVQIGWSKVSQRKKRGEKSKSRET